MNTPNVITLHISLPDGRTEQARVYTRSHEIYAQGGWAPFDYPALTDEDAQRINRAIKHPTGGQTEYAYGPWDHFAVIEYAYAEGDCVADKLFDLDDNTIARWHYTINGQRCATARALAEALAHNSNIVEQPIPTE